MNILIVTPKIRTIGRVAISHWAARKAWARPHAALELEAPEDKEHGNRAVLRQYAQAREIFLAGPWDAMLTLEDDIIIPEDAIVRLAAALESREASIAYGLYTWRRSGHPWNAYHTLRATSGESYSRRPEHARALARGELIVDVQGLGMGCTLIRREVIELGPFRLSSDERAAPDWQMALAAQAAGMRQVCDLGLRCGHVDMRGAYRIYWPDPEAPALWREEIIP
jgi:hypothetical protein